MKDAHLNCSQEPLQKLRHAVLSKYGKIHGVLKKEVNSALLERAKKILDEESKKNVNYGG